MRTTIGKALWEALRTCTKDTEETRAHARRWLAGTTVRYSNAPDFKIVMRPDSEGQWWAGLHFGVCGYSASDYDPLVKVKVFL